jgi:acyl dehydratase
MAFGKCFEDFEVGAVYKHWPGRTITEYDDTLFCMLTMNHNPLHIDANYSETRQHGQRLVAGPLVFSIALGMSVGDVSGKAIANLEYEYVKHLGPTYHGDTIYAETTVLEKRLSSSKPDRGIVTVETIAYNQRGETVLSFRRRVLVPTREADEAWQRAWDEQMARKRQGPIY